MACYETWILLYHALMNHELSVRVVLYINSISVYIKLEVCNLEHVQSVNTNQWWGRIRT